MKGATPLSLFSYSTLKEWAIFLSAHLHSETNSGNPQQPHNQNDNQLIKVIIPRR